MRLTMRTNLAMRIMMTCAVNAGRTVRKAEIAAACHASEHHVAQVVHALGQHGLLVTRRGRAGGVRLARPPEAIGVGEVFRRFEATVPFAECFEGGENRCPLTPACRLRDALHAALGAFYAALDRLTLADLAHGNDPLARLLALAPQGGQPCR